MKANVKTKEALETVSNVLNQAEVLFQFDVIQLPNRTELVVQTDAQEVKYACFNQDGMEEFLNKLKTFAPDHTDDIEELLLELA